ncbi:MAG TPA: hypothetical protein VK826_08535 [Bacteroidia bacterium]|nr:hypothetical protein [Bacteroidia bacterium]
MKKSKMNLNLMLVASAIAGATFIYSCTKDSASSNPAPPVYNQANTPPYTPCPNVENLENPYDNVGVAHNDGLEYVLAHKPQWSCGDDAQWIQTAIDLTATFVCDKGYGPSADCYNATSAMLNNVVNDYQSMTLEDVIAGMGSVQLQDYTGQLFNEVQSYRDSTQIDSLLTSIKQLEGEAITSTLNPDERRTFLELASIARYSSCYWFQEHQKSVTDWHCPTNPIPAGKYNWTKLLVTICADIAGGALGSITGPAGTVAGAMGFSAIYATI